MFSTNTPSAQCGPDGHALLGQSRHALMGIRYFDGEAGAGGGDAAAQAAAAVAAKAAADAAAAKDAADSAPWTKENFDPDRAFKLVENLRADVAAQKTRQADELAAAVKKASEDTQKATLAQFAKLLTGEGEPETDPAKLNDALAALKTQVTDKDTALTAAQTSAKAAQVAFQVALHSPQLGGNAALLLANEKFKTSISTVEPTDEAAIKAAITQALQDNAALKVTPSRSGSGEHQGATIQSLQAQLKTAEEKKDVMETIRLKRAISAAQS